MQNVIDIIIPTLIITGIAIYIWYRYKARKYTKTSGATPHITMLEVLESWKKNKLKIPDDWSEFATLIPGKIDDAEFELLESSLYQLEEHLKKSRIPLLEIRKVIMGDVGDYYCVKTFLEIDDRTREKCFEENIFPELKEMGFERAKLQMTRNLVEIMILRSYSFLKYNDAVSKGHEDWFTFYTWVTKNRWESTLKYLSAEDDGLGSKKWMYALMTKTYGENIEKLRERCLLAPPRTPLIEKRQES